MTTWENNFKRAGEEKGSWVQLGGNCKNPNKGQWRLLPEWRFEKWWDSGPWGGGVKRLCQTIGWLSVKGIKGGKDAYDYKVWDSLTEMGTWLEEQICVSFGKQSLREDADKAVKWMSRGWKMVTWELSVYRKSMKGKGNEERNRAFGNSKEVAGWYRI